MAQKRIKLDDLLLNLAEQLSDLMRRSLSYRSAWHWEYYQVKEQELKNKKERRRLYDQIYHLENFGYVNKKGFTKKGVLRLLKAKVNQQTEKNKRWDGRWRIIIFDIPEKRRVARDNLRMVLKNLGFIKLQNSVWISPDNYFNLLQETVREYKIAPYVILIEARRVSNDLLLKRKFELE